ncbi:MAG TPA: hypothetical protein ENK31_09245, partial [Nannocystis exedens]|nr:hypothetical protein [Nannocystis exedens]
MSQADETRASVGTRVSDIVRSFFAETSAIEVADKAPGAFESAVQTISASLERWRRTDGVVRFTQAVGRDRLVGVGVAVDVVAGLGRLTRLRAVQARIRLGDAIAGEVEISGPQVWTRTVLSVPGVYAVTVDALDRRGRVVAYGQEEGAPIVQVIGEEPTAAVDAELLLCDPPRSLAGLRELSLRGWSLVYFDLDPEDRQQEIRRALVRHGLQRAAILVHPRSDVEFKTLGIDFHDLF